MIPANYNDPSYDYIKYWNGREYENQAEELALKKLLSTNGKDILDVGGGFGRLSLVYSKYFSNITIADSSSKILGQAVAFTKEHNITIKTIESNVYDLSKNTRDIYDCVLMVRVCHHLDNLEKAFREINSVLDKDGTFIVEYANKLNFKSVFKNLLKLNFGYFNIKPVSVAVASDVNFSNFHPKYVEKALVDAGFKVVEKLSVSNLRFPLLKKYLPVSVMVRVENALQKPLSYLNFGPSIFLKCVKK